MQNDTIYHYTNLNAFENILKSKKIRLSHHKQMNDTTDCNVLTEIIINHDKIKDASKKIFKKILSQQHYYVASFSALKDSLSQWSRYGSSNGRLHDGVCIGFNFKRENALENKNHEIYLNFTHLNLDSFIENGKFKPEVICYVATFIVEHLAKILNINHDFIYAWKRKNITPIYNVRYVKQEIIDKINSFIEKHQVELNDEGVIVEFSQLIQHFLAIFKNPYFEEEHEVRWFQAGLIIADSKGLNFYSGNSFGNQIQTQSCKLSDKSYIEECFSADEVTEVIIGSKINESRIKEICKDNCIDDSKISYSRAINCFNHEPSPVTFQMDT